VKAIVVRLLAGWIAGASCCLYAQPSPLDTFTSPDGSLSVVTKSTVMPNGDYHFDFWIVSKDGRRQSLLNRGETGMTSSYPAGFRFSVNSQWLVRMQKIAAGESTLFLYHREGLRFVPATSRQLGDLAWDFFSTQPDSSYASSAELSPETDLVAGMDNNYVSLGEHWSDSRYVVIDLSSGESATYPLGPWRCMYDTQTGHFSVPPEMAKFNCNRAKDQAADQEYWKKNHS